MNGYLAFLKLITPQFYRQTSALFLWLLLLFTAWFFGFHTEYNVNDTGVTGAQLLGRDVSAIEVKDNFLFYFSFLIVFSIFVISKVQSLFILGEITPIVLSSGISRSILIFYVVIATLIILLVPYMAIELLIWGSVSIQTGASLWNPLVPILSLAAIFLYICVVVSAMLMLTGSRTSATILSILLCFVLPAILELKSRLLYPLFDERIFPAFIDVVDVFVLSVPTIINRTHNVVFNEPATFSFLGYLIPVTGIWFFVSAYTFHKKMIN